jgi:hypothetical protein
MHQQSARRAPSVATYLHPADVAAVLQVSPKTISRWVEQTPLPYQRPLGDHRHYPTAIEQLPASLTREVRAS